MLITLGTFNVRGPWDNAAPFDWKSRIPLLREVLKRTGLEIVGLQEPVDDQLQALLNDSVYKYIGVGRNDFKKDGEYSCILYTAERFENLESGTFALSETPDVPGSKSWDSRCPRIATWGKFIDRQTGKLFVMCNTHLDHISEAARINGIKLIVERLQPFRDQNIPLILTGDFNAFPDSETVRTAASLLLNSRVITENGPFGEEGTFHRWGELQEEKRQAIDYIFVSPEVRVLEYRTEDGRVDGLYSSDHDPVLVKITI